MVKVLNKTEQEKTKTQLLHTDEATDLTNTEGLLLKCSSSLSSDSRIVLLPSDNDRSVTFIIDFVKGSVRFVVDFVPVLAM